MIVGIHSVPLLAMLAIIGATVWRGIAVQRVTGDSPLVFISAKGEQRIAGSSFALSVAALLIAATFPITASAARTIPAAIIGLVGAAVVIIAQVQMGRAWRIGVRKGDAPVFISHGLFRFSRNPIFVGMMLVGVSAALVSAMWWSWVVLIVFTAACSVHVRIEEAHLEASFGEAYRAFRRRVPRWIGVPRAG